MRARSIKIIDLSVHTVATIPLGTSVLDCSKAMRALHVGSLVVINDDRQPVGMITDRDICIEKFYIDGDKEYPTICGTGMEDYFGGSMEFCLHRKIGRTGRTHLQYAVSWVPLLF